MVLRVLLRVLLATKGEWSIFMLQLLALFERTREVCDLWNDEPRYKDPAMYPLQLLVLRIPSPSSQSEREHMLSACGRGIVALNTALIGGLHFFPCVPRFVSRSGDFDPSFRPNVGGLSLEIFFLRPRCDPHRVIPPLLSQSSAVL